VDNGLLECDLPDISQAHGLIVTRVGTAKIALYGHDKKAGSLVKDEATSPDRPDVDGALAPSPCRCRTASAARSCSWGCSGRWR